MDSSLRKALNDLGSKLDSIDGSTQWVNESVGDLPALLGEDGPIATQLSNVYDALRSISMQLDDLSEKLDADSD